MTKKMVRLVVGLTILLGVLVTAFAWPASNTEPNDLPIAVAGSESVIDEIETGLEADQPGAIEVHPVADEAEARAAIENREVYGAIVTSSTGGAEVLVASAASPVVAQILQQAATGFATGSGESSGLAVTDVVALPEDDPRGGGLITGSVPMVIGGIISGAVLALAITGVGRRMVAAVLVSVGSGLLIAAVLQYWLGSIEGSYWVNSAAVSFLIAAISLTMVGLHALLGRAGLAVGSAIILVIGNPLSGVTTAPEMLPGIWGSVGQLLPPGAGGSLLRSTAYFDGAGGGTPLLVLTGWITLGLVLAAIASLINAKRDRTDSPAPEAEVAASH